MKLAYEYIINLCGKESIVHHLIYLFAEQGDLTDYVKASGVPAEQSINRATLAVKLTIQVGDVLIHV